MTEHDEDVELDRIDIPHHKTSKKMIKKNKKLRETSHGKTILYIFLVLLAIVVVFNIYTILNLKKEIQEKKLAAEEELRPAILNLYVLKDPACTDCVDLTPLLGAIKNANVKLQLQKEVMLGSDEATHLVTTYHLQRVPALILTGEIQRTPFTTFETRANALVYEAPTPPYTHIPTQQILGRITATLLNDSTCPLCFDLTQYLALFKQAGFRIVNLNVLDSHSSEAQTLIQNYKITKLPSLLLTKDLGVYPNITQVWSQLGTIEPDGTFVLREANPPYKDLDANKLRGLVGVTYLVDYNCTGCYPILLHKQILTNFGIVFGEEKTYDINSEKGKEWANRFNLTKVPTIILDPEGSAYPNLVRVWNQVGTIDQGYFVFRRVESLGTYKDLNTGLVVGGKKEEAPPQSS